MEKYKDVELLFQCVGDRDGRKVKNSSNFGRVLYLAMFVPLVSFGSFGCPS